MPSANQAVTLRLLELLSNCWAPICCIVSNKAFILSWKLLASALLMSPLLSLSIMTNSACCVSSVADVELLDDVLLDEVELLRPNSALVMLRICRARDPV